MTCGYLLGIHVFLTYIAIVVRENRNAIAITKKERPISPPTNMLRSACVNALSVFEHCHSDTTIDRLLLYLVRFIYVIQLSSFQQWGGEMTEPSIVLLSSMFGTRRQ